MEGARRHQILPGLDGARPLPGVGPGRRLPGAVEDGPARIRLPEGARLGLVEYGRVHDQGTPRGGKRRAKTPPTAPRAASSAACWSRATACRWAWPWTGPTAPT